MAKIPLPTAGLRVTIAGSYAFVAAGQLWIVDLTDPRRPTFVGGVGSHDDLISSVVVSGRFAYVTDTLLGLLVFDVTDPRNPGLVSTTPVPGIAIEVELSDHYAYVADSPGLVVLDVSDPRNPQITGRVVTPAVAVSVAVSSGAAYVTQAGSNGGLEVVDVTIPSNPRIVNSLPVSGSGAGRVTVDGDKVRFIYQNNGLEGGLVLVDGAHVQAPPVDAVIAMPGCFLNEMTAKGGLLYAIERTPAEEQDRLCVIDPTDPQNPRIVGSLLINSAEHGTVAGHYAYVIGADGQYDEPALFVVDIRKSKDTRR